MNKYKIRKRIRKRGTPDGWVIDVYNSSGEHLRRHYYDTQKECKEVINHLKFKETGT